MTSLRINCMMASRGFSAEERRRVLHRLVEANIDPDDPIAGFYVMEESNLKNTTRLASLPDQMAHRLRSDLADGNSALVSGLRETVRQTLEEAARQAIRDARRRTALQIATASVLAVTLLVGFGVALGAQLGHQRPTDVLQTLANTPEADEWEQLILANRGLIDFISTQCTPDSNLFIHDPDGGPACYVPLWIGGASATAWQ